MQLLFFLAGEYDDDDVAALRSVVSDLVHGHAWLESAPAFVDEVDDSESEALRTVGGLLQLPPVGPQDTEKRGLDDLVRLVDALQKYSAERGQELEFELDEVFVGDIRNGRISRTMQAGLIDPWRERVQTS